MAEHIYTNTKIYYAGHDFSGNMNTVTVNYSNELLDVTCFGSSNKFRKRKPGLTDVEISGGGFWNATTGSSGMSTALGPDQALFTNLGSSEVLTIAPRGTNIGREVYFSKGIVGEYSPSGSVGEMLGFNFTAYGVSKLVRGKIMESGNMSTTLTETAATLPRVYGASDVPKTLHVAIHAWKHNKGGMKSHILVTGATDSNMSGTAKTTYFDIGTTTITTGLIPGAFYKTTKITSSDISNYKITVKTSADAGGTTHNIWTGIIALGIK